MVKAWDPVSACADNVPAMMRGQEGGKDHLPASDATVTQSLLTPLWSVPTREEKFILLPSNAKGAQAENPHPRGQGVCLGPPAAGLHVRNPVLTAALLTLCPPCLPIAPHDSLAHIPLSLITTVGLLLPQDTT